MGPGGRQRRPRWFDDAVLVLVLLARDSIVFLAGGPGQDVCAP
ncbi:hypothetical protein [Streptomyces sp. LN245]